MDRRPANAQAPEYIAAAAIGRACLHGAPGAGRRRLGLISVVCAAAQLTIAQPMMLATRLTAAAVLGALALAAQAQQHTSNTDPAAGTHAGAISQGTAAQESKAAGPATVGSAERGSRINFQCIGCHEIGGYKASFPAVYMVPKIAGQTAKYIESALVAYRKGERLHPTMRSVASNLTDQDILDLAAYYSSQKK